jgi:hypothetical protein
MDRCLGAGTIWEFRGFKTQTCVVHFTFQLHILNFKFPELKSFKHVLRL